MNIETLNEYISSFRTQIVDSGFRRDVADFNSSLPNIDGNIIGLRDVSQTLYKVLERVHIGDLPEALEKLFADENPKPFTERKYHEQLLALMNDKAIDQTNFFSRLSSILVQLNNDLKSNSVEIDRIGEFIKPYIRAHQHKLTEEEKAIFSIIFKDKNTITELNKFTGTLNAWNRVLPIYHQLVTNNSPQPIQIVAVQNGSIDFVLNLDVKVALDLAELFKIGLIAYTAYLAQKKMLIPIAAGYFGNPKLKKLDEEKEKVLLENIGESVANAAREQHEKAQPGKSGIDSPQKAIELIRNLVTSHIVRGNDVKILALPAPKDSIYSKQDGPVTAPILQELSEASTSAKAALRELPAGSTQLLLEFYGEIRQPESAEDQHLKTKSKK